jgi:hypothetical protein
LAKRQPAPKIGALRTNQPLPRLARSLATEGKAKLLHRDAET